MPLNAEQEAALAAMRLTEAEEKTVRVIMDALAEVPEPGRGAALVRYLDAEGFLG